MLKFIIAAVVSVSLSSLALNSAHAEESLKGLSKSDFLSAYEDKMEGFWETLSILYTRIDPSLKELVPGKVWTDEDRVVSECIYDNMDGIGQLDAYITSIDNLDSMAQAIDINEDITLFNISEYPELEQFSAVEGYVEAMGTCGQMTLMQKRMEKVGLWQKLMQFAPKDMD